RVILGRDPLWIPIAPSSGSSTSVASLRDRTWPRAVARSHWRAPAREGLESREPILAAELPHVEHLQPWLDRLANLHARSVLVWDTAGTSSLAGLPAAWAVYDRTIGLKPTYLALVDFWLHPMPPDVESSPPISVLQAMAAGCIPILDPGWRLQFGQAAVYAAPSHLARVIRTLGSSPQLRRRTLEHGPAFVDQHAGPAAFGNRVLALST